MGKIPYIDYCKLSDFYTVQQVAVMLRLSIQELVIKVKQHNIRIHQDNAGHYLLDRAAIKKLHYRLYHESRGRKCIG